MSFALPPTSTATPAATHVAAASGPKRPAHIQIPFDNETPIKPIPQNYQGSGKPFSAKPHQPTCLTPLFNNMSVRGK